MKLLMVLTEPADAPTVVNTLGRHLAVLMRRHDLDLLVIAPRWEAQLLPGKHVQLRVASPRSRSALRSTVHAFAPDALYARGEVAAAALRLAGVAERVRVDIRGVAVEESQMAELGIVREVALRAARRVSVRSAYRLQTVSLGLAAVLKTWSPQAEVSVVPNGVSYTDFPVGAACERPTLLFSGSGDVWQEPAAVVDRLAALSDRVAVKVVTHSTILAGMAEARGIEASSVRPDQAEGVYQGVTALLMLRRLDVLANRVASPIKIGEGLAAGAGVLAPELSSEALTSMPSGRDWLPWDSDDDTVVRWLQCRHEAGIAGREATRARAARQFDLDLRIEQLERFYLAP